MKHSYRHLPMDLRGTDPGQDKQADVPPRAGGRAGGGSGLRPGGPRQTRQTDDSEAAPPVVATPVSGGLPLTTVTVDRTGPRIKAEPDRTTRTESSRPHP